MDEKGTLKGFAFMNLIEDLSYTAERRTGLPFDSWEYQRKCVRTYRMRDVTSCGSSTSGTEIPTFETFRGKWRIPFDG
jgi:hypothetical protein